MKMKFISSTFIIPGFLLGTFLFLGNSAFSFLIKPAVIEISSLPAQISNIQTLAENNKEKITTLILTGDIMMNRQVEYQIRTTGNGDFKFPFLKIADTLKQADLIFGNLEGPISDKGIKAGSIYSFRMSPKTINGLIFAGFNILSLANNHALDYGREAAEDTLLRLKTAGIDYAGAGASGVEAYSPVIKEVNGVKIGFLAYTDLGPASWTATSKSSGIAWVGEKNMELVKENIKNAKQKADILIVSLHSGEEYSLEPTQFQVDFSKMAVDEGADIIVGHHPHIVQKNEIYPSMNSGQAGWIFYSLGNFVFDQNFLKETMEGQIVKVIIENKKIKEVIPIDIKINQYFQPELTQ
jgi:poly-gamma-glutamate synthesis protein (capsule biosynthesis protein)